MQRCLSQLRKIFSAGGFRSTNALVEDTENKPLSEKVIILALCTIIEVLSDFHQTKFRFGNVSTAILQQ